MIDIAKIKDKNYEIQINRDKKYIIIIFYCIIIKII
jgi:hypothetical protein